MSTRLIALGVIFVGAWAGAGEPHLSRVVAWDAKGNAFLEARWSGVSHEGKPPQEPPNTFSVHVDGQVVATWSCTRQELEFIASVARLGWKEGGSVPLAAPGCTPDEVLRLIPGVALAAVKEPGLRDRFRVRRLDGSKAISATRQRTAVLEVRRGKAWVEVHRFESSAVPAIAQVFAVGEQSVIIIRLDIPTAALGIPSSTELALFYRLSSD